MVAAGAAISGTVTGVDPATAQSVALANVNVGVYGQDGSPLAFAATSNTGLFTIKGLAAGKYTLSFQAWSQSGTYLPQWWSNKATQATATRFAVTAGQVLTNYN